MYQLLSVTCHQWRKTVGLHFSSCLGCLSYGRNSPSARIGVLGLTHACVVGQGFQIIGCTPDKAKKGNEAQPHSACTKTGMRLPVSNALPSTAVLWNYPCPGQRDDCIVIPKSVNLTGLIRPKNNPQISLAVYEWCVGRVLYYDLNRCTLCMNRSSFWRTTQSFPLAGSHMQCFLVKVLGAGILGNFGLSSPQITCTRSCPIGACQGVDVNFL
jgi:hypothetical protein